MLACRRIGSRLMASLLLFAVPSARHDTPAMQSLSNISISVTSTSATISWQPLISAVGVITYRLQALPGPRRLPADDLRKSVAADSGYQVVHFPISGLAPGASYVFVAIGSMHGAVVQRIGPLVVTTNPLVNSPFPPNIDCAQPVNGSCDNYMYLQAIDEARRSEGLGLLSLPSGFGSMPPALQLLAVLNLERVSRGLPAFSDSPQLNAYARAGVARRTDPTAPSADYGSIWSNSGNVLESDYMWMYVDGFSVNQLNLDCMTPSSQGCWGHREIILTDYGPHPLAGVYASDAGSAAVFTP